MEQWCQMSRDKHDGVALGLILGSLLVNKPPARQPCFGGILHLDHLPVTAEARKPSKIPKQGMIDTAEIRKPISEVLPIGIAGPLTFSLWLFSSFRYVWALTELCSSLWRWAEVIRLHRYVGELGKPTGFGWWEGTKGVGQRNTSQNTRTPDSNLTVKMKSRLCQWRCCLSFKEDRKGLQLLL